VLLVGNFDHCHKPHEFESEIGQERKILHNLKRNEQYEELRIKMKRIRRYDLRCVDLCDFIVFNCDPRIHTVGSYDEVFTAEDQHKPIFVICSGGLNDLPDWLFAFIHPLEVFKNIDELIQHLNNINNLSNEEFNKDSRWMLIRKHI
jgi:hypothetical protein